MKTARPHYTRKNPWPETRFQVTVALSYPAATDSFAPLVANSSTSYLESSNILGTCYIIYGIINRHLT